MKLSSTILCSGLVIVAGWGLSGCTSKSTSQPTTNVPAAEQKAGTTTKTGVVSSASGKYYLTVNGKQPEEIDSYSIDLSSYVGQTITIEGQYSGNTLFVGAVK